MSSYSLYSFSIMSLMNLLWTKTWSFSVMMISLSIKEEISVLSSELDPSLILSYYPEFSAYYSMYPFKWFFSYFFTIFLRSLCLYLLPYSLIYYKALIF